MRGFEFFWGELPNWNSLDLSVRSIPYLILSAILKLTLCLLTILPPRYTHPGASDSPCEVWRVTNCDLYCIVLYCGYFFGRGGNFHRINVRENVRGTFPGSCCPDPNAGLQVDVGYRIAVADLGDTERHAAFELNGQHSVKCLAAAGRCMC